MIGERRSGRTTAQLRKLPDGAVYIVVHSGERDYCRALLQHLGRKPNCIRFVTLDEMERKLIGLSRSTVLDVDHFVFGMRTPRQIDFMRIAMQRYTLPPMGDPA